MSEAMKQHYDGMTTAHRCAYCNGKQYWDAETLQQHDRFYHQGLQNMPGPGRYGWVRPDEKGRKDEDRAWTRPPPEFENKKERKEAA